MTDGYMVDKKWIAAIVPGIIALVIIVFIIALFVIKLLWSWIIPDLFPGAVAQGLVAGEIGWYSAFKLAIILALLGGTFKANSEHTAWRRRDGYGFANQAKT